MTGSATPVAQEHQPIDAGKVRRAASGIPIVPALDGFRGFAVLGIVIFHTLQNAAVNMGPDGGGIGRAVWAIDPGATCLNTLFIVSGFVLFLPTAARDGRFGKLSSFAVRRGARLIPAYFLVLTLMLVLIATVPFDPPIPFPSVGNIALTYTTLEVPAEFFNHYYFLGFEMNRAIWTLAPEVTFYVLLAIFATRWFRHPFIGLAITAVIGVVWRILFMNLDSVTALLGNEISPGRAGELYLAAEIQFPFWAFSFGVGMTMAYLATRRHAQKISIDHSLARIVQVGAVAAFVAIAAIAAIARPESILYSPPLGILYVAAIGLFMTATIFSSERWQWPFTNGPVRWLGDISYGVYLIHLVIITCLARLVPMPRGGADAAIVWLLAVIPLAILWGYLSARLVERPVRAWASRWGARQRTTRSATGP